MKNSLDKIDVWHEQRYGKFTASMIYKLLTKSKDNSYFSVGAMSYIEEKAIETMTVMYERPELESVESLIHGKTYEEHAYHEYIKVTKNYNMRHFGSESPLFLDLNEYSGGSPDGIMGEGENIYIGMEIKCPLNSKNHFKYLKFKTQWDLKESRIEYYSQIQFLLMITNAEYFHFVSYDERFRDEKLRIKVIDVYPDSNFQNNIEAKLLMAQKEKIKIINSLMDAHA